MTVVDNKTVDFNSGIRIQGSNQSDLRERNERLVLTILRREGALPRAEVARISGLSAQTISVIVRALEQDGLLESGEKVRGKVGQPSVPMRLAPNGAYFFGLKVGRRSAELILVNFVGDVIERRRVTYQYPTPNGTLRFVKSSVNEILGEQSPELRQRVAGMGIASPYFMWEWASAIGVDPKRMESWKGCDLREEVSKVVGFPVFLGNDATCACGAELVFGMIRKPKDFLHFYIGFFIGGGVVLNGQLYTGAFGNAGAIGPYPSVDIKGAPKQLVDVASLIGLERRMIEAGEDPQALWEEPETLEVDGAIVSDWLDEAAPALTHTILSAISVIDFAGIVIDGSMPPGLRDKVVHRVRSQLSASNLSGLILPDIIAGSVGVDARPLGAASLPLSNRFLLET